MHVSNQKTIPTNCISFESLGNIIYLCIHVCRTNNNVFILMVTMVSKMQKTMQIRSKSQCTIQHYVLILKEMIMATMDAFRHTYCHKWHVAKKIALYWVLYARNKRETKMIYQQQKSNMNFCDDSNSNNTSLTVHPFSKIFLSTHTSSVVSLCKPNGFPKQSFLVILECTHMVRQKFKPFFASSQASSEHFWKILSQPCNCRCKKGTIDADSNASKFAVFSSHSHQS